MAKRAAKKVKKKSPAKKKTKANAKSKKAVKKPARKKSSLSPLPPLKTLLKGKRIAFAGDFSNPDKSTIAKFFSSLGGKATKTIDGKLDILLVGEGQKPAAQTKAEKLNAKGDADILIIDKPFLAIPDFKFNQVEYLTSPDQFVPFSQIVNTYWLDGAYTCLIDGVDFSKKTIGSDRHPKPVELQLDFSKCCFDRATIQNVDIGRIRGGLLECELSGTVFERAYFDHPTKCKFTKCKGS